MNIHVAHVAAHIGGGVGSVLKDFFELSKPLRLKNDLFCLDKCETNFSDLVSVSFRKDALAFEAGWAFADSLQDYDVVLIHYWNHPLMAKFLATVNLPSCRLVIWGHNSGLFEPHIIPRYLVDIGRKVLFTSACSFKAPNLQSFIAEVPEKFGVVHSTRVLDDFHQIGLKRDYQKAVKNLLYVGTVSDAKIHPQTPEIFAELSKLGFLIRVVGGPDHVMLSERVAGFGGKIEVFGPVSDVNDFYEDADLFIYPLREDHYGTGEQVILEAMASGLPVIAFNNPAEYAIMRDGGGLLVGTSAEFVEAVNTLANSPKIYQDISKLSIERVSEEFNVKNMAESLCRHLSDLMENEKSVPILPNYQTCILDELKIYSLNSFFDGDEMCEEMCSESGNSIDIVFSKIQPLLRCQDSACRWLGNSKSTPFHYLRYFPESAGMRALANKIDMVNQARSYY